MPIAYKISIRIIFAIVIILPYTSAAQLNIWPHLKSIELNLPEETEQKIKDIFLDKRIADELIRKTASAENNGFLHEAYGRLFASSEALFELYNNLCMKIRAELPDDLPPGFLISEEYEQKSESGMDKAAILKKEAAGAEDIIKAEKLYEMAFDLEAVSLLYKARALRIYQDFPILYEYPWDDDFTVMDSKPVRAIRVIEIDESSSNDDSDTELTESRGIYYIIQIAAHTEMLNRVELNAIYRGDREIKMIIEDNWHKYYLGPWESYDEADRVFRSLNLRNAFIAAYDDGKRIGVNEARRKQAQQN